MRRPHIYNPHHYSICLSSSLPTQPHPEQLLGDPISLGPDEARSLLKLQDLSFLCSKIVASSVQQREESHETAEDVMFN